MFDMFQRISSLFGSEKIEFGVSPPIVLRMPNATGVTQTVADGDLVEAGGLDTEVGQMFDNGVVKFALAGLTKLYDCCAGHRLDDSGNARNEVSS